MRKNLLIINAVFGFALFLGYNYKLIFGEVSTNIASWCLWSFISFANVKSYVQLKVKIEEAVLAVAGFLGTSSIFLISLFKGNDAPLQASEIGVLLIGIIAVLFLKYKDGKYANFVTQLAIAVGFIPLIKGVYQGTLNEPTLIWFLWSLTFLVQMGIMFIEDGKKIKWDKYAYPGNCFFLHFLLAVFAYFR